MRQPQEANDRAIIEQEQADQQRRTTGATLAARALEEVLPAVAKGYGPNMHKRVAERMAENMSKLTFHVDHYEPDDQETGTRMVVNCNVTEQHAGEAASMLEAAPDLYAAVEMVLDAATEDGHELSDSEICNAIDWKMLRAASALARARGQEGGGE